MDNVLSIVATLAIMMVSWGTGHLLIDYGVNPGVALLTGVVASFIVILPPTVWLMKRNRS